jgi:hypothetical protein
LGISRGDTQMTTYYTNQFTGLIRKFVNGKGFNLCDDQWVSTNCPEDLIKRLPYYVASTSL